MTIGLLAAALLSSAAAAETPRAFVERLYAGYRGENYNPLARPARIFARPLVAALEEEARLARDEVGFMDADPLCQCQDPGGLRPLVGEVRRPTPGTAVAHILLRFGGSDDREIRLDLVRTRSGWRIADLGAADEPSLLRSLRAWNRRKSSGR